MLDEADVSLKAATMITSSDNSLSSSAPSVGDLDLMWIVLCQQFRKIGLIVEDVPNKF